MVKNYNGILCFHKTNSKAVEICFAVYSLRLNFFFLKQNDNYEPKESKTRNLTTTCGYLLAGFVEKAEYKAHRHITCYPFSLNKDRIHYLKREANIIITHTVKLAGAKIPETAAEPCLHEGNTNYIKILCE